MLWPMYCGSPLFGTSGGIEQEDVSMNEYLKQYIELQKQFRETKGKADSVRALYAFKAESDTAKILELLKNPETAALLKQIVSAL